MFEPRIARRLSAVARRLRQLRLTTTLAAASFLLAGIGLLLWQMQRSGQWHVQRPALMLAIVSLAAFVACLAYSIATTRDLRAVARRLETRFPELDARLLTALEQQPAGEEGRYGYLQEYVIREALYHEFTKRWFRLIPTPRLAAATFACCGGLLGLIAVIALLAVTPALATRDDQAALIEVQTTGTDYLVDVEPGDTEIERGTGLLVTARFAGAVPPEVQLFSEDEDGQQLQVPMRKSLDDPLFGVQVPNVTKPLTYHVQYAGKQSKKFRVSVYDLPQLERADVQLEYPSYTNLPPQELLDVRRVTAVEGTNVTVICHVNKPLASVRLVSTKGPAIELAATAEEPLIYRATWQLTESSRYRMELIDAQQRSNKAPEPELIVTVTANRPPEMKWVAPARDTEASPLEELQLAGNVQDDFGLVRYGLTYSVTGHPEQDVVLGEQITTRQPQEFAHLLDFEALKAEPNQLVAYHLWAEDVAPDGQPRRVMGDMFFCEVRHFEEIFRQGQQTPGGQEASAMGGGGGQQQAEQLVELQKQSISGTWNLLRRETLLSEPSPKYAEDLQVLHEAQEKASGLLEEMGQQLNDAELIELKDKALQQVQETLGELEAAAAPDLSALESALAFERSVYQTLLEMRAREFEVSRANSSSSSGSSGGSSPSQQQLNQLELKNDQSRYETEKLAQDPAQDQAQRELRQAVNRLRELARRQQDLNERIQQLKSALEAAQTQQEQEELQRQLQRLREEQQEIMRDAEELQERMQNEQNQQQMSDQSQQLAETREQIRNTSEALQQGQLSQALTSGTRAERQLEDLQQQLREKASSQFEQEMRQMRDESRKLAEDQAKLVEQLGQVGEQESTSLRGSSLRDQAQQTAQQQTQRLDNLMEQIKETVQQAETSEPLLSKRLYDTYRQTLQEKPQEALAQASQWIEDGIPEEAEMPARAAQQGINTLAQGIEQAAESVLGDQAEALRRARDELDQLAEQLHEEITREDPQQPQPGTAGDPSAVPGQTAQARPARSESADGENSPAAEATSEQTPSNAESSQNGSPGERPEGQPGRQPGQQPGQQSGRQPGQQPGRQPGQQPGDPQTGEQSSDEQSAQQQPSDQQGQQPDPQPGEQAGQQGQQPGQQSGQQPGQQPGQQSGQQPGQSDQQSGQQGGSPTGEGSPDGERPDGSQEAGGSGGGGQEPRERVGPSGLAERGPVGPSAVDGLAEWMERAQSLAAPLTGNDFLEWSDRLRDVEEMLDDAELRAEAAKIRDRARGVRIEFKRHSREPSWELVRKEIEQPLVELRERVEEAYRRQQGDDPLAPVDRDPVPAEYEEQVRRYYERLGSGR